MRGPRRKALGSQRRMEAQNGRAGKLKGGSQGHGRY